jgi:hypothetical protein
MGLTLCRLEVDVLELVFAKEDLRFELDRELLWLLQEETEQEYPIRSGENILQRFDASGSRTQQQAALEIVKCDA